MQSHLLQRMHFGLYQASPGITGVWGVRYLEAGLIHTTGKSSVSLSSSNIVFLYAAVLHKSLLRYKQSCAVDAAHMHVCMCMQKHMIMTSADAHTTAGCLMDSTFHPSSSHDSGTNSTHLTAE